MNSPREDLPSYDWASYEPVKAGVTEGAWQQGLAPVVPRAEMAELPDSPVDVSHDLVPVAHPRIRVLGAYFHEAWPYAVPGAWVRPAVMQRLEVALHGLPDDFGLAMTLSTPTTRCRRVSWPPPILIRDAARRTRRVGPSTSR